MDPVILDKRHNDFQFAISATWAFKAWGFDWRGASCTRWITWGQALCSLKSATSKSLRIVLCKLCDGKAYPFIGACNVQNARTQTLEKYDAVSTWQVLRTVNQWRWFFERAGRTAGLRKPQENL